jgi:hypothetical protein
MAIADIRAGRQWHNGVVRLVASWIGRGWSNAEILLACEGLTLAGWTVEQTRDEVSKAIAGARRKWNVADPVIGVVPPVAPVTLVADRFVARDLNDLEAYDWVYPRLLIARYFTALGAPPGTGKTALTVVLALSIVTGRALLGGEAPEPAPVWLINLEDPREAILKLVWAACIHYGIEPVALEGRLFINAGRDSKLVVAKVMDGLPVQMPVVEAVIEQCKLRKFRAVFIDPVVDTHGLNENDNVEMNEYCAVWNRVADATNAAFLLSMHFRKGGVGGDPDSFRGASAIIGKARTALTLSTMTAEDARKLNVDPDYRRYHLRMDNAKRNLTAPPAKADWLRLESVPITTGDSIQVLRTWIPPSPWEGLSNEGMVRALDELRVGVAGDFYSANARARGKVKDPDYDRDRDSRWAGDVVLRHADPGKMSEDQAKVILAAWLRTGLLVKDNYYSPTQYKERDRVLPDPVLLAKLREQSSAMIDTQEC